MRVAFKYDYRGRRVEKRVEIWDTTLSPAAWNASHDDAFVRKFVWDGWKLLMEIDGSDNIVRRYTYGLDLAGLNGSVNSLEAAGTIGGLLAVSQAQTGGGAAGGGVDAGDYLYLYDANGNVGQVVDWTEIADWQQQGLDSANDWHATRLVARYEYDPYGSIINSAGDYAEENPLRFSTKYWDDETGLGYWGYRYYDPRLGRWMNWDPIGEAGGTALYAYVWNKAVAAVDAFGLEPLPEDMPHNRYPSLQALTSGCAKECRWRQCRTSQVRDTGKVLMEYHGKARLIVARDVEADVDSTPKYNFWGAEYVVTTVTIKIGPRYEHTMYSCHKYTCDCSECCTEDNWALGLIHEYLTWYDMYICEPIGTCDYIDPEVVVTKEWKGKVNVNISETIKEAWKLASKR